MTDIDGNKLTRFMQARGSGGPSTTTSRSSSEQKAQVKKLRCPSCGLLTYLRGIGPLKCKACHRAYTQEDAPNWELGAVAERIAGGPPNVVVTSNSRATETR
jgi:hypothetical protein